MWRACSTKESASRCVKRPAIDGAVQLVDVLPVHASVAVDDEIEDVVLADDAVVVATVWGLQVDVPTRVGAVVVPEHVQRPRLPGRRDAQAAVAVPSIATQRPTGGVHLDGPDAAQVTPVGKHRPQDRRAGGQPGDEAVLVVGDDDHRRRRLDGDVELAPVAPQDDGPGRPEGRSTRRPRPREHVVSVPVPRRVSP